MLYYLKRFTKYTYPHLFFNNTYIQILVFGICKYSVYCILEDTILHFLNAHTIYRVYLLKIYIYFFKREFFKRFFFFFTINYYEDDLLTILIKIQKSSF